MKDWSPNSKNKVVKAAYNSFRTGTTLFLPVVLLPWTLNRLLFFSATEAVQVNPGASFLERALGVSGFWSLQHGNSRNHRILEAQDSVSGNIDPKQRTLKQYVADRCQVETVSIGIPSLKPIAPPLSLSGRNIMIIIIELLHLDGLLVKSSKA